MLEENVDVVTVMIVETETGTTEGIGTGIGMIVAGTTATAIVAGTLQHSPGNFYSSSPPFNSLYALKFFRLSLFIICITS